MSDIDLSVSLPAGPHTVAHVRRAQELGYRRAWVYDSPALYRDVWMTLAVAARETDTIGLGCGVIVPSLRHVLVTASAIATLEALAPGRAAAAVGTGFTGRRMLGQPPLTWASVAAYVRTLRALLRGEDVEVDGAVLRMCHPAGWIPDRPITTPVLIAAGGPKGIGVARELGDGVLAMGEPAPGFAWSALAVQGTVLDPGETLESPRVFETLAAPLALTYHFVYETTPDALAQLPGGAEWRRAAEEFPPAIRHLAVHEGHCVEASDWERPFLHPQVGATSLTGDPATIRARVDELGRAGLTELVFNPTGPDIDRELETMAAALGAGPA